MSSNTEPGDSIFNPSLSHLSPAPPLREGVASSTLPLLSTKAHFFPTRKRTPTPWCKRVLHLAVSVATAEAHRLERGPQ